MGALWADRQENCAGLLLWVLFYKWPKSHGRGWFWPLIMSRVGELVGRERERAALDRAMSSDDPELVAVYGRRRVGKTFLIREHFGKDVCFELTGVHDGAMADQLTNFSDALARAGGRAEDRPRSWAAAFTRQRAHLESLRRRRRKRVVFLDELPWLASRRSRFLPAFEHFWNSWASRRSDFVFVVCGSAAAWMVRKVIDARGGLHNRVTRRIRLEPFDLFQTEQFLESRGVHLDRYAVLELYMAMGGVAHYLKEVERGQSAAAAIDSICFARDGLLREEFGRVFASLFEHHERHERLIRALASHPTGLTRSDLASKSGDLSGGRLTRALEELEESGFVQRTARFGRAVKDAKFRLGDEYSLFFIHWIEKHRARARNVWTSRRGSPAWRAWSGYAFESICLKHTAQLKQALGIEAVETQESTWDHRPRHDGDRGAQIDLLVDRKDMAINLCEMKFSEGEFVVDKRYADDLRRKRDVFRNVSGTRKSTFITMVTTFGVADNKHRRSVVDVAIEMDALFNPP